MTEWHGQVTDRETGPGFSYCRLRPDGPAALLVDSYWEVRAAHCRAAIETALPDANVEIYFNLGPTGRQAVGESFAGHPRPRAAWVAGPRARSLLIAKETRDCHVVGVRLRPAAARQVLGVPVHELGESLVDLDAFWGTLVDHIREKMAAATHLRARIAAVQCAVVHRGLPGPGTTLSRFQSLCSAIDGRHVSSVAQAAELYGTTHRRLIALFRDHVGLRPKTYARIQRLRTVMHAAGMPRRPPWAQLAVLSGFHDQAHLIHEFRRLTGLTPIEYAERRTKVGVGFVPYRTVSIPGRQESTITLSPRV